MERPLFDASIEELEDAYLVSTYLESVHGDEGVTAVIEAEIRLRDPGHDLLPENFVPSVYAELGL